MPQYTAKVLSFFGKKPHNSLVGKPADEDCLNWDNLGVKEGLSTVAGNEIYFKPLDDKATEAYRQRYAGSQADRTDEKKADKKAKKYLRIPKKMTTFALEKYIYVSSK